MYRINKGVVDACQWSGSNWHEILAFAGKENVYITGGVRLWFNGVPVKLDEWLIKTSSDKLFRCSNALFNELFHKEIS